MFEVPFHEVCELVARRGVVIHRGYAFVPHGKFHTVVRGRFRTRLNKSLAIMRRENTINRMVRFISSFFLFSDENLKNSSCWRNMILSRASQGILYQGCENKIPIPHGPLIYFLLQRQKGYNISINIFQV